MSNKQNYSKERPKYQRHSSAEQVEPRGQPISVGGRPRQGSQGGGEQKQVEEQYHNIARRAIHEIDPALRQDQAANRPREKHILLKQRSR